ncbi:hypothetical protein BAL199_17703 [alpha proteobacterium BAL199]|jgi:lysylphosphatidylglycerol synthetase-like protein (DUF2156 family)|nr:hypothetical protein BAL199_17703 [alpha proteobacterium BAL199]
MSTTLDGSDLGQLPEVGSSWLSAALAAVSVGVLVASTLGTVAAIVTGTGLGLLGLPDAWATGSAATVALVSLAPAVALGRRVWQLERQGFGE